MKALSLFLSTISALMLLDGCVSVPTGPSVMALPGTGKSFEQFQRDDIECRQYAQYQTGGTSANQAAVNSGLASAAVGTAVGAIAGAAMGGHEGAGVGAGTGLLVGTVAGAGAAQSSARGTQRGYDIAYTQCMYAKGEQVSVPGFQLRRQDPSPGYYYAPPPPPPGYVPPR